ncbi:gluconate 2-dehydrogenase subunit 3 family protein [Nostoc sp. NIES-2111]
MERRNLFPILGALALPLEAQHEHHKAARIFAEDYQLRAFSEAQDQMLARLTDIIIPDDETARGAGAAKVSRYFDLVAHYVPEFRAAVLDGLSSVEAAATLRFGAAFGDLNRAQQTEIVREMAQNEGEPRTALERFFAVLKFHTVEGYRLSHIGQTEWIRYKPHPGGLYPDLAG